MKPLIVICTYNEKENIALLVQDLFSLNKSFDILVVDDTSPDGTAELVKELQKKYDKLHLLVRPQKQGLGRAYIAGFKWGIEKGFDAFIEMDADFSHRPKDLPLILENLVKYDFVIGSRYVVGGSTVNWGIIRKVISRGGGVYSRLILGFPVNDWTGGFNAWKKSTLDKINLDSVASNGYSFQIELKYKALKSGCSGIESPIVFEDRRVGQSKMSFKIVLEAFWKVWKIRFS